MIPNMIKLVWLLAAKTQTMVYIFYPNLEFWVISMEASLKKTWSVKAIGIWSCFVFYFTAAEDSYFHVILHNSPYLVED